MSMRRKLLKIGLVVAAAIAGLALAVALGGLGMLRGSLARLEGERPLAGLEAPVLVERDAQGVPRVTAGSRDDAARALGYLHAQERFFQMDLMRRAAAGELAGLLGPSLLPADRDARRHRFRARLEEALIAFDEPSRALLEAYADGTNAGLRDLRARPPEYLVLRQQPRPWRPLDSLLVVAAMYMDLGLSTADADLAAGRVRDTLPPALAAFLLPEAGRWDAPVQGGSPLPPPLPAATDPVVAATASPIPGAAGDDDVPVHDRAGSNNWAVAGRLTRHGGALLANDMHLGLGLPNIWYRAELRVAVGNGDAIGTVGVTLPGTPAVVAGSNGRVAWGFTNAYADWLDLVVLEVDPADPSRYRTPEGWDTLRTHLEVLAVAGAAPETLRVNESRWGPVWATDTAGRPLALRWAAHDPGSINVELARMADARTVDDAVALAPRLGMPGQNLVCADLDGRIAWTIAGRVPRRVGWNGRWPISWADGTRRWDGWVDAASQPRVVDPPEGRLWTANNRVAAGEDLRLLGDGGYGLGARAAQIRDGLRSLDRPDEAAMLALQLDDRALMLDDWRRLALEALERSPAATDSVVASRRARFAQLARDAWDGHASTGSVGYRVVRALSVTLLDLVYAPLTAACREADPRFDARELPLRHSVAWELLTRRPANLVPAPWPDWDQVVAAAVDTTMARLVATGRPDSTWTWGDRNTLQVVHPFAAFAPRLRRWLQAPAVPLPGDSHLPRVQHPKSGASERFVVSPGRERDGLFHMPGGQSGHPLSPFFLAGHEEWVQGRASPLLPGEARHRLQLVPAGG
jgi:penicillin amidase